MGLRREHVPSEKETCQRRPPFQCRAVYDDGMGPISFNFDIEQLLQQAASPEMLNVRVPVPLTARACCDSLLVCRPVCLDRFSRSRFCHSSHDLSIPAEWVYLDQCSCAVRAVSLGSCSPVRV